MKKLIACVLLLIMISAPAAAYAEEWDMSVPTEVTEEIREIFDKAAAKLVGVNYTPVAVLGKNESTYCIQRGCPSIVSWYSDCGTTSISQSSSAQTV